jgi:histidine phosphotransferase ChpT
MNNFTELLATKLCHDMAGPISAVHNGLEFMMMEDESGSGDDAALRKQAIQLVQDSSAQSLARLQAYRVAYGMVRGSSETMLSEVKEIFRNYFHKSNIKVEWVEPAPDKIASYVRRILVSSVLIVSKIIIYGGTISISFQGNKFSVKATAPKIKDPKELVETINVGGKELTLENVVVLFTKASAEADSMKFSAFADFESEVKMVEINAEY